MSTRINLNRPWQKKSKDVYGAEGQSNLLNFDPAKLTLVTDENSPLYDARVHLAVDEALARNIDYQGVLEPIAVSKNPETGETEVVFGRQRVKAARLANEWRRARATDSGCCVLRQSALDA
ncbi:ParB N-terminal domain-containing protein [Achromobacter xylosoxidans]|uniref:ParB N-terminal domain-containing protein n=1 Tax=Alcaligenes xylosoxydans xylosoxydans TaxID=85698 RepID=UPI000A7F0B13|nr:ParB N-terminal domain-containing protein [Achromobacter xylosoxidans]